MEKSPGSYGNLSAEQAAPVYIDPVAAVVTDTLGHNLGNVGIVAPVANVTTRFGARRAAIETVHSEIGPGLVEVSGGVINDVFTAGLEKAAALKKAEAAGLPDEILQVDPGAKGTTDELPPAEVDQTEQSADSDMIMDIDDKLPVETVAIEDGSNASAAEAAGKLYLRLGEIALPVEVATEADSQESSAVTELAGESAWQLEAVGELVALETTEPLYITERPDNLTAADDGHERDGETESIRLQRIEYNDLQELADEYAINMLATLAVAHTTETDDEAGEENIPTGFEELTVEDMALMSLAAHRQELDSDTDYVLAA